MHKFGSIWSFRKRWCRYKRCGIEFCLLRLRIFWPLAEISVDFPENHKFLENSGFSRGYIRYDNCAKEIYIFWCRKFWLKVEISAKILKIGWKNSGILLKKEQYVTKDRNFLTRKNKILNSASFISASYLPERPNWAKFLFFLEIWQNFLRWVGNFQTRKTKILFHNFFMFILSFGKAKMRPISAISLKVDRNFWHRPENSAQNYPNFYSAFFLFIMYPRNGKISQNIGFFENLAEISSTGQKFLD